MRVSTMDHKLTALARARNESVDSYAPVVKSRLAIDAWYKLRIVTGDS